MLQIEPSSVLTRLMLKFREVEARDLRVGDIWMTKEDIGVLWKDPHAMLDKVASREMMVAYPGLVAFFCGAYLRTSSHVPPDHLIILQSGLLVEVLDSSACEPF